jgi:hypothetical protein
VAQAFLGKAVGILPVVAFPAVLVNVGHGQNGFMSAALFGAGTLVLDRYPNMAGILFGCLAYKPQLAVVIPIALAGARRWNTLIAAASTALGLALLSLAVFGPDTWQAFLAMSSVGKATLESGFVDPAKMQSTFAAFRLLHANVVTAYLAQVVILLAACAAQHRTIGTPAEGPAMIAAALLATPFLLDYDLLLLAIPLAWLTREGLRTGFLRWEKIGLMAGFILPAVSRTLALTLSLPLAPAVIGAILFLMVRRAARETANSIALPVETRQAGAATVAVMAGP